MLALLMSLSLGVASPTPGPSSMTEAPALTDPGDEREAPVEELAAPTGLGDCVEGPAEEPAPATAPTPPTKRRLSRGQRLVLGSAIAYGLGSAIQWTTAGTNGMLAGARPGGTSGVTLGMNLGGMPMGVGVVIAGIGGGALAKESHGHDHRAKPMLAGGAVVTSLGGAAILGTALMWPTIRDRCPIGVGCNMAAMHIGGAVLGVGAGMISHGNVLRRRDPNHHRLSKRAQTRLVAGGTLLGGGYFISALIGLSIWRERPDDPVARRTRDRMLIPVVGPWIHAAGPDASMLMAVMTGGLGAMQIGGTIALAMGAGLAGHQRRRQRERVQISVAPSFDGVSIVGRF